jgi:hypothetical protein
MFPWQRLIARLQLHQCPVPVPFPSAIPLIGLSILQIKRA